MAEKEKEYGNTLNLPKTSFQMKANLPVKEVKILEYWDQNDIYNKGVAQNEGREKFILHDGPPYANGYLHLGTALNKVLKDIIIRYKRFSGYHTPYIPGWDTHGMPIEFKVIETLGEKAKEMSKAEIRVKCREYAEKFIEIQKEGFIRLGVFGNWKDPYLTLDPGFEAKELEIFGDIYENGYIFRGLKPVYWSTATETALAEAEIEYYDVTSPSIYVRMEANKDLTDKLEFDGPAWVVIWTTTPWTLPANLAIAFHPDFVYGLFKTPRGNLILAKDLAARAFGEMGIKEYELIKEFPGTLLENTTYKHTYLDKTGLIILGTFVTAEEGTGTVHSAPGHGQEDYVACLRYGLPVFSPMDNKGRLTEEAGRFAGLYYDDANREIIKYLTETGHILQVKEITHSYPHDWRSKKPVVFRATEQWFIQVEGSGLRDKLLKTLDDVQFIPAWGRNRIGSMLETRPDWCISRQRIWGVPIPVFYNEESGEEIYNRDILNHVVGIVRAEGTNAWWTRTAEELIGEENLVKYGLKGKKIRKDANILDVWFDSGSSHAAVLENPRWPDQRRPADMYLEGSDQHRGWFQTSFINSVASRGDTPFRSILTHGFVVDEKGIKFSKSLGNAVDPYEVIKVYGADILRLWTASADYREDIRVSDNILKNVVESYRRIRNTARYILGNIGDFDATVHSVPYAEMEEIDRWALLKLEILKKYVTENYDKYEFYNLFQAIHYFAGVDMSAFYLDIIKDRLYTEGKDSRLRRSAQTAMTKILTTLCKMIAPVLSFTAEEIWSMLPESAKEKESVHLTDWYKPEAEYLDKELEAKWEKIIKVRKEVNKLLEKARQGEGKIIGNSLDAKVYLFTQDEGWKTFLSANEELLKTVFIVSQLALTAEKDETYTEGEELKGLFVKAARAGGDKCPRCWKYSDEIGSDKDYPALCPRCAAVLKAGKPL
ncbi:MAG: isoleucine--tRNA ligase [Fusobacteriaceae bacterium]|jgi:isoleucyl-tRNA synthetase|nr:isoleucine--tRNA ligase [Fusobacteriaceae bacterium]